MKRGIFVDLLTIILLPQINLQNDSHLRSNFKSIGS